MDIRPVLDEEKGRKFKGNFLVAILFTALISHVIPVWGKLESLGNQGKILKCIKAMYSDVKCKVKVGGEVGNDFSVTTGI